MPAISSDPAIARQFAGTVVERLRQAGHETYWAGGCVRDDLLGRIPADYDVATAARPDEVRGVFGMEGLVPLTGGAKRRYLYLWLGLCRRESPLFF